MLLKTVVTAAPAAFVPEPPEDVPVVTRVSWAARRIPVKRGSIRGFHPNPLSSSAIAFESLLECNVISALLAHPEVLTIQSQPLTIWYRLGNKVYSYTPDLMVTFRNVPEELAERGFGRLSLIECKPEVKLAGCAIVLSRAFAALREVTSAPLLIVTNSSLQCIEWEAA